MFATRAKGVLEIILHGSCALYDFYEVTEFFLFEGCFSFLPRKVPIKRSLKL